MPTAEAQQSSDSVKAVGVSVVAPPSSAADNQQETRPRAQTRRMPTLRERRQQLDTPVMYDQGSTMSKISKKGSSWLFGKGGDLNDPLVGMTKPLVFSAAGSDNESEDDAIDYTQFANADEAEAARVSRLKDMEGLFQIKIKETPKSGADVNVNMNGDGESEVKVTSVSRMLEELGRQQSKADRYGWRLRYMRLTNNLTAGGGRNMWGPGGPRRMDPPSFSAEPSPSSPMGGGEVADGDLTQYARLNSPPPPPSSTSAARTPSPTVRSPPGPRSPGSPNIKLVRRGSGYFDGFQSKSVVDVDAAVLEIYHVDVDNVAKTFTIKSKAMAIPLKCMTLVRRGKIDANRALEFPTDTPTGKEYKFGHLRLEVLFDTEVASHSPRQQAAQSPTGASAGSSSDQRLNVSGVFGSPPRASSPTASHPTTIAQSDASVRMTHHELEIITSTARERDLWYDWISSFILHADLVDLHTDKEKPIPQYTLKRPTAGVASFISFFLSGKRKADALNTVIGGISGLGGAIGAGFKPLITSSAIKPPNQGEIFIVTPFGPQAEHRCRVSCPKPGECVMAPLDTDDVERVLLPLSSVEVVVKDPLSTSLFLNFKDQVVASQFVRQCGPIIDVDFDIDPFDDEPYDGPERDDNGVLLLSTVEFRTETCYDRDQMADWFTKISGKNLPKSTPYVYERETDDSNRFTFRADAASPADASAPPKDAQRNTALNGSTSDDDADRVENNNALVGDDVGANGWLSGARPISPDMASALAGGKGGGNAKGGASAGQVPLHAQKYHRNDARSVLAKVPTQYYKKKPRMDKGITLSAEVLRGQLSCLLDNPFILANQPPPNADGSRFISADLLDYLVRPLQGWAIVGYNEIGRLQTGAGVFTRRAIAADYAQQTIIVMEGLELEEVCVKLRFSDISCVTAFSKVFGSMGFTLHCFATGIELMVIPEEGGDAVTERWLDMLDGAGRTVRPDASREEVNDRYLRELKDEKAKLDAMQGVDLCENNDATLLPCVLCGKQSYVCDVTGIFHADALRRLAVIDKQQQLQTRKSIIQEMEEDFATSSDDDDSDFDDPILGAPSASASPAQQRRPHATKTAPVVTQRRHDLPKLSTWLLSSLVPETRELPADVATNDAYIDGVIKNAMSTVSAAEKSLAEFNRLFPSL